MTTYPDAAALLIALGSSRLTPYRTFFRCTTDEEVLGAYFWGQAVATAFQPALGLYEIVLRNAIHRAASQFSSKKESDSYAWYDSANSEALTIRGKTKQKVQEILYSGEPSLRRSPQPTPDAVVALLSFGFWPSFLSGLSQRERPRILTDVFQFHPNTSPKHWSLDGNVSDVISALKEIQNLRNAVAHYEPIWKPHRLTGTERNWSHSVASLRRKYETLILILRWCCPDSAHALELNFSTRNFKSVCSTDAVRAFMASPFDAGDITSFALQKI